MRAALFRDNLKLALNAILFFFVRSILPEGPVGQNGKLSPGDEILEVNGQKLLGLYHVEVVKILRELPNTVRLVCSRKESDNRFEVI